MSKSVIILLFVIAALVAVKHLYSGPRPHRRGDYQKKRFLTRPEIVALDNLEKLLPQCRIHAQVSMGALLQAKRTGNAKQQNAIRYRFSQKIVDFVIQDRATNDIVALVELDDRTHSQSKDRLRDQMTFYGGYKTIRLTDCKYATIAAALSSSLPTVLQNGNLPRSRGL